MKPSMELMKMDITIKGRAMPAEYVASNSTPLRIVSWLPATMRILPSIGPMHGLQPAPKAIPIKNVPKR